MESERRQGVALLRLLWTYAGPSVLTETLLLNWKRSITQVPACSTTASLIFYKNLRQNVMDAVMGEVWRNCVIVFPLASASTRGLETEARRVKFNQWQLDAYLLPVSFSPVARSLSGCPCPSPLERWTITTVTPDHHIQGPPVQNTVCALTANERPWTHHAMTN